jgi:formylglycine-generating enzyme required for sulfatase activity
MHGNLWQWCQDLYGDYPKNDVTDPQGPEKGTFRVIRGGSWDNAPVHCRSAVRFRPEPGSRSFIYGFRLCFSAE